MTFFAFTPHGHFTQSGEWPVLAMMNPPLHQMGITLEKALQTEQLLHPPPSAGPHLPPHQQTLQHRIYVATEANQG